MYLNNENGGRKQFLVLNNFPEEFINICKIPQTARHILGFRLYCIYAYEIDAHVTSVITINYYQVRQWSNWLKQPHLRDSSLNPDNIFHNKFLYSFRQKEKL
jgi:hypothetical protein